MVEAGGGKVNADQPKGGRRENFAAEKQEQRGWKMKVGEKERRKPLAGQCGGEGNQKGDARKEELCRRKAKRGQIRLNEDISREAEAKRNQKRMRKQKEKK